MYQIINKDVIYQFLGEDPDLIKPMLEMILNNSLPELEQLDELYENGDYESVRIKVHKAKSAMGYVGAQQTRQLLLEIEKGVKEVYPEKNAQLKSELEIVRQEVQQFISEI